MPYHEYVFKQQIANFYSPKWLALRLVIPVIWLLSKAIIECINYLTNKTPPPLDAQLFLPNMLYNALTIIVLFILHPSLIKRLYYPNIHIKQLLLNTLQAIGLLAPLYAIAIVVTQLMPASPLVHEEEVSIIHFFQAQPLPVILLALLIGSLQEELFFRELPLLWSSKQYRWLGYLWQGVFASLHLYQSVGAALFALLMGWLFWSHHQRHKQLYVIVLAHFLYNFLTIWHSF